MPKDILDIVDTAIKIGLGASISGVTAYYVGRYNHASEKQKYFNEHKLKMIESLSEDVEKYFKATSLFIGIVSGINKNNNQSKTYTKEQFESIKELDSGLILSWQHKDVAVSKLRLLSANKAYDSLRKFSVLEKEFRDPIIFKKIVPNSEVVESSRHKAKVLKQEFHKALASLYSEITTL